MAVIIGFISAMKLPNELEEPRLIALIKRLAIGSFATSIVYWACSGPKIHITEWDMDTALEILFVCVSVTALLFFAFHRRPILQPERKSHKDKRKASYHPNY